MVLGFKTAEGDFDFTPKRLIVAGWTGRDGAAVQHHIDELAAIGVAPPSTVPLYYQASCAQITQSDRIETLGPGSSGEVEPVLICHEGTVWLGLGSDHTDRDLEAHSVAHSKQICAKPLAKTLWKLSTVCEHLDRIELTAHIIENGSWTLYQTGTIGQIRPLADLAEGAGLDEGGVLFCGTFAAIGGVRPARRFKMTMTDPILGNEICGEYGIDPLDVVV